MSGTLEFDGRWRGPRALLSAGTALGTAWADIGTALSVGGARWTSAWIDVTINDSNDARFRLVGQTESGGSAYTLPIQTVGASAVSVEDQYYELNTDEDQKMVLTWELAGALPFVKFQARVGTAGGTAAELNSVDLVTAF